MPNSSVDFTVILPYFECAIHALMCPENDLFKEMEEFDIQKSTI